MSVFDQIISPFIFIIRTIYLYSYELTGNYGWAIILLSFFISLLLLPVFILIEKAKKKDDAIKQRMQPLVDEIKRVYKGQERYYYIKTLNRQYNYSALKALIPILSLVLQIPFFIAAYQYLEGFEPLAGIQFAFIKDLSQPDNLFGAINFLPIAMTLVNLLTAWFYTRNGNTGERKQMLVVAGIFLILLFNLPSGLVLYWTMNNVFSFFRLFVTNREVFKKTKSAKKVSLKHQANIFITEFEIHLKVIFSLLFLSIYFFLSGRFYFLEENKTLYYISILLLAPSQFIFIIYLLKSIKKEIKLVKYLIIPFLLLVIFQSINLLHIIKGAPVAISIQNININSNEKALVGYILSGFMASMFLLPLYMKQQINYKQNKATIKLKWSIFITSILFISGLIFFWQPTIVFSSSPETFNFAAIKIFSNNIAPFVKTLAIAIIIFLISPSRLKQSLTVVSVFLVITAFVYSFIIPLNLGSLQETRFSEQENLALKPIVYIVEGVGILILFYLVKYLFNKNKHKAIFYSLVVLNIFIIGQSIYNVSKSKHFFNSSQNIEVTSSAKPISFSKEGQNIVFFIADGFQGWYIKDIIKDNPELKETLKGFTWYPNTISIGNYTHASMPSIMGSYRYNIDSLNNNDTTSIRNKWYEASKSFISKVKEQDYTFSSEYIHYTHFNDTNVDYTIPYWNEAYKAYEDDINLGIHKNFWYKRLYENALFSSVPLFLKPIIYNNQKWLSGYSKKEKISNYSYEWFNFIRLLPFLSNTESKKSNFIYLHNDAAHNPWHIVKDNGKVIYNVEPYKNNEWYFKKLALWIKWMQDNDVYNNTKIILLSDHGPTWSQYDGKMDIKSPADFKNDNPNKVSERYFWRLNPLLMVKDFNAQHTFAENWQLMSNADASAITFDENDPRKLKNKNRILDTYWTFWASKMIDNDTMQVHRHYKIKDNVYDLKNWQLIK